MILRVYRFIRVSRLIRVIIRVMINQFIIRLV